MADQIEVRLEGGDKVLELLELAGVRVEETLSQAGKEGAQVIQKEAQINAPGEGAIEIEVVKVGKGYVEVAIGPKKEKWYYRFFETGTAPHEISAEEAQALFLPGVGGEFYAKAAPGGMPAEPFLRPALDGKGEEAAQALGRVLWRTLEELFK